MSDDDFYSGAARQRMQQLQAERAAALADLAAHRANGDYESAGQAVQQVADLDAAAANLGNLYSRYVQSQQPPAQPELTPEERQARPISKMDWSDTVALAQTSRYGKNLRADDPNLIQGWREARRRSARGE
jgi:hypothetical protein